MARVGRAEANSIAGEEILFKNDKSKVKVVEGMVPPDQKCIAPLFNIVRPSASFTGYKFLILYATDCRRTIATSRWRI